MGAYLVECKKCSRQALVNDGRNAAGEQVAEPDDPHTTLVCDCCTENHHHGQAADPDTGTGVPCRPIIHFGNAVVRPVWDGEGI